MVLDWDEPAEMTSALRPGSRTQGYRPSAHGGNVHTVAARPTCHPDKLKLVLVGTVYDRNERSAKEDGVSRRLSGREHHVDPVVAGLPGVVGEAAGGALGVDAVAATDPVLQRVQRSVVHPGGGEVAVVGRVVPGGGEVRGDVHRAGGDRYRAGDQ